MKSVVEDPAKLAVQAQVSSLLGKSSSKSNTFLDITTASILPLPHSITQIDVEMNAC